MENQNEIRKTIDSVAGAMLLSPDSVSAAGAAAIEALTLESMDQAMQLARCIAAFTTDDALADEMEEIVDESAAFLISKVGCVKTELESFSGPYAELEKRIWTLVYAGRRERARVMQTLARRSVL